MDIYIPKSVPTGLYQGTILIQENGATTYQIPVELSVRSFTLPDVSNAKAMLYTSYENINKRYLGEPYPDPSSPNFAASRLIRDRHFLIAHRHRISLIDNANADLAPELDQPPQEWLPRLDGSLFTAVNG